MRNDHLAMGPWQADPPDEDDNAQTGSEETKGTGGRTPEEPLNPPSKD
jgi:hypothetical protein